MWCQFGRWKLVLTSNLKWREWKKSLYSTLKKKHWYYWKIVEEFLLKRTKFKHVDQLARDNSSLTLVKGCHLWLKSQKCFILGCIVYFYLFKASVSKKKRPQRFFPSGHLSFCPLEPPSLKSYKSHSQIMSNRLAKWSLLCQLLPKHICLRQGWKRCWIAARGV